MKVKEKEFKKRKGLLKEALCSVIELVAVILSITIPFNIWRRKLMFYPYIQCSRLELLSLLVLIIFLLLSRIMFEVLKLWIKKNLFSCFIFKNKSK